MRTSTANRNITNRDCFGAYPTPGTACDIRPDERAMKHRSSTGRSKMFVSEVEENPPVVFGHRMFARADIISKRAIDQLSDLGHLSRIQATGLEQAIDGLRSLEHFKLTRWIRPGVFSRVRQKNRTRSTQSNQGVLIERQFVRLLVEILELGIEPMRKMVVDLLHRFADFAPTWRRAAAAGLERYRQCDSLVKRRRDQGRFAVARVSHDCDFFRVDRLVGYQVVHGA